MTSVGKTLGFPASSRTYEDSKKLALGRCLTGVEFECENVKAQSLPVEDWADNWEMTRDDSLRGAGMEFVLKTPLFGQDLIDAISGFCGWAAKSKFETNYRTGLHIHIDVRNLEMDQLIAMVCYYALFEKVLFHRIGKDREGSIFCMPFYKAEGTIPLIAAAFSGKDMKMQAARVDRYGALNLNALSKYGSVEWRHFQTTFDDSQVIEWINLAQSFKKFAKSNPMKPGDLLGEVSKSPKGLFDRILGPELADKYWYPEAEKDIFGAGLNIAQDLAVMLSGGNTGMSWESVKTLRPGTNLAFAKWAKKFEAVKLEERPENIFEDPNFAADPELQHQAIMITRATIVDQLLQFRFN